MQVQMKEGVISNAHKGCISKLLEKLKNGKLKAKKPKNRIQSWNSIKSLNHLMQNSEKQLTRQTNQHDLIQFLGSTDYLKKVSKFFAAERIFQYLKGTMKSSLEWSEDNSRNKKLSTITSDPDWGTQKYRK